MGFRRQTAGRFRGHGEDVVVDDTPREDRMYYDLHEVLDRLGLPVPVALGRSPKLAWRKPHR